MFKEVPSQFDFPKAEHEMLAFWEQNKVYEKSLEKSRGGKPFVFFEGPPTANGMPHPGHCLTRAIKDLFPRYKTMTGHYCLRKAGWDTHGLPVEVEVCKELGIHTKEEIEAYGVEAFNRKCLESVFRYTREWEEMTRRLGFWINLGEAYVTYHQSYIESVWWALKSLFDAGLLYQGHKIVWWWAQGGTALSAGEVGQGYREVDDLSVFVRFPLVGESKALLCSRLGTHGEGNKAELCPTLDGPVSLLVWTTTPWTLPSNMFTAVHRDFDYALVHDEVDGERLILACALYDVIAGKLKATKRWKIERTFKGADLVGLRYTPPFDCYSKRLAKDFVPGAEAVPLSDYQVALAEGGRQHALWRVLHGDFVTLDAGSGLVHEAPAFGEVDFNLFQEDRKRFENPDGIPFLCSVAPNGAFTADMPKYAGRWVKDCDKEIIQEMKQRKVLVFTELYRHDYPFCWRAEDDPLIQYPRKSWFIRTTQFKDDMLDNNQQINWLPDHIKAGRFGKFLESNVDWALSRERYWGTPLPIWVCENPSCGHKEAVDSYAALSAKPGVQGLEVWEKAKKADPALSDHLRIHKPYIDAVTFACPKCKGGRMQRVADVIDCWFDSGSMPFAQWGFPHKTVEMFQNQFPADFISEALDQTRGWFYSLTAISVMLFGKNGLATANPQSAIPNPQSSYPMPFKTCIVLGLLMGEDGLKMSKSKKNYRDPSYVFEHQGADAMRWLFFSGQTPWTSIRFQESTITEGQREFLIRLYNCYSFFVIYANIDKWTPGQWKRSYCEKSPTTAGGCRRDCPAFTELDRWIMSELNQCCVNVFKHMEAYDNYNACKALIQFVDALSNWYVRRSRERFWRSSMDDSKQAAYATLHECLVTLAKLLAPFTPFLAESMYQNLVRSHDAAAPVSVHLCDYPITEATKDAIAAGIDAELNAHVDEVRQLVSCGRAARSAAKIRVRQPLAAIELHHRKADVIKRYEDIIKDELNVKRIDYVGAAEVDKVVHYELKPDFRKIGPKHGSLAPKIKAALAAHAEVLPLVRSLEQDGECQLELDGQNVWLTAGEVAVELHAKEGWTAERIPGSGILVLDTHMTPELKDEGTARDLVNQVQQIRKQLDLRYEQRISLAITGGGDVQRVVDGFGKYIMGETLAQSLLSSEIAGVTPVKVQIDGGDVAVYVKPLPTA
jgi:isoleucyl-tRNA synthetase